MVKDWAGTNYPSIENAATWVALYHTTRCALIKVKFVPSSNIPWNDAASTTSILANSFEPMVWLQDNDGFDFQASSYSPTDQELMRNEAYKIRTPGKPWKLLFRPNKQPIHPKYPTIEGATQTNSSNQAGIWHGSGSSCGTFGTANGTHVYMGFNGGTTTHERRLGTLVITTYHMFKDPIVVA